MLGYVVGGFFILVVVFLVWRISSVSRGMRQRDERILLMLEPIGQRVLDGETIGSHEIVEHMARPELRYMMMATMPDLDYRGILSEEMFSSVAQGEASLAYWMMHPNELQDPPEMVEHMETMRCEVKGRDSLFHVYRYKMPKGHWAGEDWLLGLAGPMNESEMPYEKVQPAFSRCSDKEGDISPRELIEWWADMLEKKGFEHES